MREREKRRADDRPAVPARCYVQPADFDTYFRERGTGQRTIMADEQRWDGVERRIGPADRRSPGHERRFDAQRGRRRFVVGDRRVKAHKVTP